MSEAATATTTFFDQPCRRYRNFQMVFLFLTGMFGVSSIGYTFLPGQFLDGMLQINTLLGGSAGYDFPDRHSDFWRLLGCGNVVALALCCFLMHRNLRDYYAVIYPLACMKGFVAVSWTVVWAFYTPEPLYLVAGLFDGLTFGVILWVAPKARRALDEHPNLPRIPALR